MKKSKIKISRQLEANDCGPACLHMIAEAFTIAEKLFIGTPSETAILN